MSYWLLASRQPWDRMSRELVTRGPRSGLTPDPEKRKIFPRAHGGQGTLLETATVRHLSMGLTLCFG